MSLWECPKCKRKNPAFLNRCPICKTRNPRKVRTPTDRKLHQSRMKGYMEGLGR